MERVFPRYKRTGGRNAVQCMGHLIIFDGNHAFGIHAEEGIASDVFATFDALQQKRGCTHLCQFEIDRNRRFEIGEQDAVNWDEIALLKQAMNGFTIGERVGAR